MNQQLDEQGLYGIYDVWHVPWWQTTLFYRFIIGAALWCLFLALFFLIKKLRNKKNVVPIWERAIQQLEDMQNSKYATVAYGKECYFKVTEILKCYLHKRYGFDTAGKTDKQLIAYLQTTDFPQHLLQKIETIFTGGLTIKFANVHAVQKQIKRDITCSITLIKQTIPESQKSN